MEKQLGTEAIKRAFPEMLKGGVIMDVMTVEQAKIAEDAGASAVMALEKIPAEIRKTGGVARMSDPEMVLRIKEAVTIPVMAKCRIGHFVEAEVLQTLGIDCIDESEVLTPADEQYHIYKHDFVVPFVCGARDLGEALRRIGEGAAMIRSKGEAGTGNIVEAVRHLRSIRDGMRRLTVLDDEQLMTEAKNLGAPYLLVREVRDLGRLPVVLFCAGGVATPADAALVMRLGCDGVFVGSGIFHEKESLEQSLQIGKAIVEATTHYEDPEIIARVSSGLPKGMTGIDLRQLRQEELMASRGW